MQCVAHGMIEILMPVGTFLRSGLAVWEQESPNDREGRKSRYAVVGMINADNVKNNSNAKAVLDEMLAWTALQ